MPASQPNFLHLAKQGDVKAIEFLINRQLQPRGTSAKASFHAGLLKVELEANELPDQETLVAFIQKGILGLGSSKIKRLRIEGRRIEDDTSAWVQELELIEDFSGFSTSTSSQRIYKQANIESSKTQQPAVRQQHTQRAAQPRVSITANKKSTDYGEQAINAFVKTSKEHGEALVIALVTVSMLLLPFYTLLGLLGLCIAGIVFFLYYPEYQQKRQAAQERKNAEEQEHFEKESIYEKTEEISMRERSDLGSGTSVDKPQVFSKPSNASRKGRLYSEFIGVLKSLQRIGYAAIGIIGLLTGIGISSGYSSLEGSSQGGLIVLLIWVLITALGCFVNYIVTEGFIAVIDLLSRIEQNTRN